MEKAFRKFGLGNYLGYDLIGKRGFIPGSDYYDRWYPNKLGATTIIQFNGQVRS